LLIGKNKGLNWKRVFEIFQSNRSCERRQKAAEKKQPRQNDSSHGHNFEMAALTRIHEGVASAFTAVAGFSADFAMLHFGRVFVAFSAANLARHNAGLKLRPKHGAIGFREAGQHF
jgi:hypothetical protein